MTPEKVAKAAIMDAKKGKGYVGLLHVCKMSAFQCENDAAETDNENLDEVYQEISLTLLAKSRNRLDPGPNNITVDAGCFKL